MKFLNPATTTILTVLISISLVACSPAVTPTVADVAAQATIASEPPQFPKVSLCDVIYIYVHK